MKGEIEEVLKKLKEMAPIEDLPASTVELAKQVVQESQTKTPEELNEWAERLVSDIVDAED